MHVTAEAGDAIASSYEFIAAQVVNALFSVGKGDSYREATIAAKRDYRERTGGQRRNNRRKEQPPPPVVADEPRKVPKKRGNGQLVANWVEVFTDSVVKPIDEWPPVVLLDSTRFEPRARSGTTPWFEVLFAYGYDLDKNHQLCNPRLLKAEAVKIANRATWSAFLDKPARGTPLVAVSDGMHGIKHAVQSRWGIQVHVRCTWHMTKNLRGHVRTDLVAAGYAVPQAERHPLHASAMTAFTSPDEWALYWQAVELALAAHPTAQQARRWRATNERHVLAQMRSRNRRPRLESTAPLEDVIHELRKSLKDRAPRMKNKERTNRLLSLMVAARQPDASVRAWSVAVLARLHADRGKSASKQKLINGIRF
jgi:hypothetical protein